MFGWFKKKAPRLEPESKWIIVVEGEQITVRDDAGEITSIAKSDLTRIAIETNDSGPWGADLWWLLFDESDQLACAFPQGATGEDAVTTYFTALPMYDHAEMFKAMRSTDNALFLVWRRPS